MDYLVYNRTSSLFVGYEGSSRTWLGQLLLLLLNDNPSFSEIGVGAPSRRNVSMDLMVFKSEVHSF